MPILSRPLVAGIAISNPDRVVYPGTPITKLALAHFYERIAPWILPHLTGRPLTLVRCPEGLQKPCFYMKHSKVWALPAVRRVEIQEKTKVGEYLVVDTLPALISIVQMNVLEIHTWNTCVDHVEHPDRIVFDIDPGEKVSWEQVVDAARLVRRLLRVVHLQSFPKTTGGTGLHVVVPLRPSADWRACLEFSRMVATTIERHNPRLYTTSFPKAGRERKILIDYLRNNRTNTSVSAYSTRARDGAAVSMPLTWRELTPSLDPRKFNVLTLESRLARRKDPWAGYWNTTQRLPSDAMAYAGSSSLVG
jgi:bifunctional non-homologous end joining protein LigD